MGKLFRIPSSYFSDRWHFRALPPGATAVTVVTATARPPAAVPAAVVGPCWATRPRTSSSRSTKWAGEAAAGPGTTAGEGEEATEATEAMEVEAGIGTR